VIESPVFGEISADGDGTWQAFVEVDGAKIELELSIDTLAGLDGALIESLTQQALQVRELDRQAREALEQDCDDDDSVVIAYREHLLKHVDSGELEAHFGEGAWRTSGEAFVKALTLLRIVIYPEQPDGAIAVDYGVESKLTDHVLCLAFDIDGEPNALSIEA